MLRLLRHYMPRNDEGGVPHNDRRGLCLTMTKGLCLAMTKGGHASQHNSTKVILTSVVRGSITIVK